jgi:hypothetical protein
VKRVILGIGLISLIVSAKSSPSTSNSNFRWAIAHAVASTGLTVLSAKSFAFAAQVEHGTRAFRMGKTSGIIELAGAAIFGLLTYNKILQTMTPEQRLELHRQIELQESGF